MSDKTFDLSRGVQDVNCHLMPCRIEEKHNMQIKAKEYFYPTIRVLENDDDDYKSGRQAAANSVKNEDKKTILQASFRGRPLQGREMTLPHDYCGHILTGNKSTNKFSTFTYWNWDEIPNDRDVVAKAFQWIDIANAIHDY